MALLLMLCEDNKLPWWLGLFFKKPVARVTHTKQKGLNMKCNEKIVKNVINVKSFFYFNKIRKHM